LKKYNGVEFEMTEFQKKYKRVEFKKLKRSLKKYNGAEFEMTEFQKNINGWSLKN
jgi:hypothetical protein